MTGSYVGSIGLGAKVQRTPVGARRAGDHFQAEFGILQRDHAIVPEPIRHPPSGVIVTFVVADCDEVYASAKEFDADVLEPPTDMFYGQRRLLLRDPDGTVVDVSSPTAAGDR